MTGRGRVLRTALLLGAAAAFLLPQLWLFSVSLKTKSGVFEYPPRLVGQTASFDNYRFVLERTQVPTYLWNSGRVAVLATLVTLLLGLPAAYVLSRERFRSRGPLLTALLVVQTVSPIILLVPIYAVVAGLRLLDTHTGLVLVYAAVQLPLTIVIMKTFFDAVPPSLFEAALLDGASRATAFRRVALPLVAPGLAATATTHPAAVATGSLAALALPGLQLIDPFDGLRSGTNRLRHERLCGCSAGLEDGPPGLGLADAFGSVDYVAREVIKAEDVVDFTVKENFPERLARKFGATLAKSIWTAVGRKQSLW